MNKPSLIFERSYQLKTKILFANRSLDDDFGDNIVGNKKDDNIFDANKQN